MKQKWSILSFLLALILVVGVFPVGTLASGNMEDFGVAMEYSQLDAALNTTGSVITIYPEWGEGDDKTYFHDTWPSDPVVVNLKAANRAADIWLGNGTLIVPEQVTINAYDPLLFGSPDFRENLILNGTWNMMTNQGYLGGVSGGQDYYGKVEVRPTGKVVVSAGLGTAQPFRVGSITLNGTLQCDSTVILADAVLGSAAQITGKTLWLGGTITGPSSGYSTITVQTYPKPGQKDLILQGNLRFSKMTVNTGTAIRIAAGSHVVMDDLYIMADVGASLFVEEGATLTVNKFSLYDEEVSVTVAGTLDLANEDNYQIGDAVFTMDGGTMIVRPNGSFGNSGSAGIITGSGELRLYGEVGADGEVDRVPVLYSRSTKWNLEDLKQSGKIGPDVTIWRNWVDAGLCEHLWVQGETVAPTCGMDGYTAYTCQNCYDTKKDQYVAATWDHEMELNRREDFLVNACKKCDYSVGVYWHETEEGLILAPEVNCLKKGDLAAAAIYDDKGKFLGIDTVEAQRDGGVGLLIEVPANQLPATVKVFAVDGDWSAKREAEELALTGSAQEES